jgi:hypothetical protein
MVALGLWWNANTISHNFIHRPFFRSRILNRLFSTYLTLLLGFPQAFWRDRHLLHHAGINRRPRWNTGLAIDIAVVLALWTVLSGIALQFTLTVYLPGFVLGLILCQLQGYFEHSGGLAISHYGRLYNFLFFNDGYHAEHHARPGAHWSELPHQLERQAYSSRWPATLRWLDTLDLCLLEQLVLHSSLLQSFVLRVHKKALLELLRSVPNLKTIEIVGGGLFPRTALILKQIAPQAKVTLVDMSANNLGMARQFLGETVEYRNDFFDAARPHQTDLLIIPLALKGNRQAIYESPPAPVVLVHDWIWRKRGSSVIVSWLLLKRLNSVVRPEVHDR